MKPDELSIPTEINLVGSIKIEAASPMAPEAMAAEDDDSEEENDEMEPTTPRLFSITAYTGAPVEVGLGVPVVFDLSMMEVPATSMPILREHDKERIAGFSESVMKTDTALNVNGKFVSTKCGKKVMELSDQGFPWQASVGLQVTAAEYIDEGAALAVNGRMIEGPAVRVESRLREVSFVTLGADGNTSAAALKASAVQSSQRMEVRMSQDKQPTAEEIRKAETTRMTELRAAFPNDAEFAMNAFADGLSLIEAKAKYADVLAQKLEEAKQTIEASSKARAVNAPVPATIGAGKPDARSFREQFDDLVSANIRAGMPRARAVRTVVTRHPEIQAGLLVESNGKRRNVYIPDAFAPAFEN